MKSKMLFGVIGALIVITLLAVMFYPSTNSVSEVNHIELTIYFSEELRTEAIERMNGAIPIEGFDPNMYMGVYPALMKGDFNGARAYGGVWNYNVTSDELVFERIDSEPITSADGTVNEEGMQTLLFNLAERFNVDLKDNSSVNEILEKLA